MRWRLPGGVNKKGFSLQATLLGAGLAAR